MNLRQKLRAIAVLASITALIVAGILVYSQRLTADMERKIAASQTIIKESAQLGVLAFNATQSGSTTDRQQWLIRAPVLVGQLTSDVDWTREESALLGHLADLVKLVQRDLEELAGAKTPPLPEYERRLRGQVIVFSQAMTADARELATTVLVQGKLARERANTFALPLAILLALAVPVIAIWIVLTITPILNRMQATIEQLARGDLSSRMNLTGNDELSALGQSFDDMASSLQQSHSLLSQEIAARMASEAEVRLLNADLARRVEARTAELALARDELEQAHQRAREASYLEQNQQGESAIGTDAQQPLRETAPQSFGELIAAYQGLLDAALERQVYKVENRVAEQMKTLVSKMGRLRIGPRDVMDIHIHAMQGKTRDLSTQQRHAHMEEARYLLLETMGNLVTHYRMLTMRPSPGEATQ